MRLAKDGEPCTLQLDRAELEALLIALPVAAEESPDDATVQELSLALYEFADVDQRLRGDVVTTVYKPQ